MQPLHLPSKTVPSSTLQREIGTVIKRVAIEGEHLTISNNGIPVAVLVPVADYKALIAQKAKEENKPTEQTKSEQ
jgi:prevent-host-death family protein